MSRLSFVASVGKFTLCTEQFSLLPLHRSDISDSRLFSDLVNVNCCCCCRRRQQLLHVLLNRMWDEKRPENLRALSLSVSFKVDLKKIFLP